jgi:hypothetical protein
VVRGLTTLVPSLKTALALLAAAVTTVTIVDLPPSMASPEIAHESHVTVALGATQQTRRVGDLAPGDGFAQPIDVNLARSLGRHTVVTIAALPGRSSLLDRHPVFGLRLAVDRCLAPEGWRPGETGYRCATPVVHVLGGMSVALVKDRRLLLEGVTPGTDAHLLLRFRLPAGAGNAFERQTSLLRLTFAVAA